MTEKDKAVDIMEELIGIEGRIDQFNDCNKKFSGRTREFLKRYINLSRYITRGGFIQDRNGKWCKEGDSVKFGNFQGVLIYNKKICSFGVSIFNHDGMNGDVQTISLTNDLDLQIELIEPCEPDICKDFEGE